MKYQRQDILPAGRQAGVCMHITSLAGPYGIGEIGRHAFSFIDVMREMGLGVWQFLPLGPTAFGDSPYQPLSTFAGNELLIDIHSLIDLGLLKDNEASELESLPTDSVDYGSLIPAKSQLLRVAASRFRSRAAADLKAAYDEFLDEHDGQWLHDYAVFRVLKTQHDERPWPQWEPQFVHRDTSAMQKLETSAAERIESVKIVQFLFRWQWEELRRYAGERGVTFLGDVPIYIALDSSDAWVHRDILQIDRDGRPKRVAGVPPDYFSADGQLWGNPVYAWPAHAADRYRWWVERIAGSIKLADLLRIDHFRGFESYWSIRADADTAREGRWEPGPGDAIFNAMRDALEHLPIVAEDLGVITPEVEALRDRFGFPGMVVLQFGAVDTAFCLDDIVENSICYTGTHDNDTTFGWFHGNVNDLRSGQAIRDTQEATLGLTGGTPESIHSDLIRTAFSSKARLAMAPMQDYLGLGSEARMNTPGTPSGNWRWRLDDSLLASEFCDRINAMVSAAGRDPGS